LLWFFHEFNEPVNFALLTSYFIKAQAAFVGRTLISKYDNSSSVDINTGKKVDLPKESKWICKELSLSTLTNASLLIPFFILENEAGEMITVRLQDKMNNTTSLLDGCLVVEERYLYEEGQKQLREEQRLAEQKAREEQRLKKEADFKANVYRKYGQKYGALIIDGKVTLGMNKEMCTLAWGEPFRRNRTIAAGITCEQWVYGWHHYLYFENGVLVEIQD
jgi:hypothetical protein